LTPPTLASYRSPLNRSFRTFIDVIWTYKAVIDARKALPKPRAVGHWPRFALVANHGQPACEMQRMGGTVSMSGLFDGVGIKLFDGVPGTGSRVL